MVNAIQVNMSKVLGIDYGEKRVGLAISDENHKIAFPLKTFENKSKEYILEEIKKICSQEGIKKIVLGLPIPKKEKFVVSQSLIAAQKFVEHLQSKLSQEVITIDEILSTKMSKRLEGEDKDTIAAMLILQDYLDQK